MNGKCRAHVTIAMLALIAGLSVAEEETKKFDPEATRILRRTSNLLRRSRNLKTRFTIEVNFDGDGKQERITSEYEVAFRRPNKLALILKEGMGSTVVCDGKKVYTLVPLLNKYTVRDAPKSLADVDATGTPAGIVDGMAIGRVLFADKPYAAIMEGVRELRYAGTEQVDGTSCHRLDFVQEGMEWRMWITADARPLPARMKLDLTEAFSQITGGVSGPGGVKVEANIRFGEWELNARLPSTTFKFTPPEGAEEMEAFFTEIAPADDRHPLLGRQAPEFEVKLLSGEKFRLSERRGKDVVVLDFWASWCPPCVEAWDKLARVVQKYEKRGVAFCAINQGEDTETILNFLNGRPVIPVGVDQEQSVGARYGVEGIPQTVIIGKDGIVQAVHVGFGAGYEEELTAELDALLRGEDLVKETPPRLAAEGGAQERKPGALRRPLGARAIPSGPDAPTSRAYAEAERELSRRQILQAYEKASERDPKWDKSATEFLRQVVHYVSHGQENKALEGLLKLGRIPIDAGCEDPMVLFWYAHAQDKLGYALDAERYFRSAAERFKATPYPVTYEAWSEGRLWQLLKSQKRTDPADRLKPIVLKKLAETVASGDFKPGERRVLLHYLQGALKQLTPQERVDFSERIRSLDKADPWIAHVIAGYAHVRLGWDARGGGWAHTVAEDGWKEFADHLAKAREHLTKAWKLAPESPESAEEMITVAMAGHAARGQTPRFWFDRAVSAQLDHLTAYSKLRWALQPRWGGSHREMYDFGLECAATKRYDTWVPAQLFWAMSDIADNLDGGWRRVLLRPGAYDDVQKMLDGYAGANAGRASASWALSMKAAIAYRAERWKDARDALDAVAPSPDPAAFKNLKLDMGSSIAEAYARSGTNAEALNQTDALLDSGDFESALRLLRPALEKTPKGSLGLPYIRLRVWTAERRSAFAKGDWVDITPGEGLLGWRAVDGTWTREPDGAVTGTPSTTGLKLMCEAPFSRDIEIKGVLEFVHSPYNLSNVAIMIGGPDVKWWHSVMLFLREKEVAADFKKRRIAPRKPIGGVSARVKDKNEIRIRICENKISVHLNGEAVVENHRIEEWSGGDHPSIGVGARYWYTGPKMRFRDLKVRRATEEATKLADDL